MGWFISRSKYLLGGWVTTGLAGDVFHGSLQYEKNIAQSYSFDRVKSLF
jgi:hypothetical protein